jgi:hypothetical protein
MARPLRLEFEGALYHLTGRGNARQRIFADQKDCARQLSNCSENRSSATTWRCTAEEMGDLFGGAGYTAVSQMIRRTREKEHKSALKFNLAAFVKKCAK